VKTLRLLVALALASAASQALATNGMRMIGFGPVQNAMGGVSAAVGLDAASVLSNPATMSLQQGRVDFGATWFQPEVDYRAVGAASGNRIDSDRGPSPVPALGLVVPAGEKFRFGLGAYGVAGMGVDFQQDLLGSVTQSSYSQMRFTPGVSYQVNELLAVGVTANLMYAQMEFSAVTTPPGGPMSPPAQSSHMAASAFGGGATLGVIVSPREDLRFGAAYETRSWFQDFEFHRPGGHDTLDFDQPQSALVGLAYSPWKPLLLAADVQWIRWSETNGTGQPRFDAESAALPWNLNWDDQVVYKLGVQYTLPRMVMLRAGYNYGKSPVDPGRSFENVAFPAIAEHHVTVGIGHELRGGASINASAGWSPRSEVSGGGTPEAFPYEARMSQLSFDMGLAYRF
jgi:long-chain fatty acid transport protein